VEKHEISYRSTSHVHTLEKIKLQIPGWAGNSKEYGEGKKSQPWHCKPFVDASTYGLELVYPFKTKAIIKNENGKIIIDADWKSEGIDKSPIGVFSDGFYGMSSCMDIKVQEDMVIRIEPHPKYYTDESYTTPLPVPGHLQTNWWSSLFFVVFKIPEVGKCHVFKFGEPYAQILILPKSTSYEIKKMSICEIEQRKKQSENIDLLRNKICKKYKNENGDIFDDRYKKIANSKKELSKIIDDELKIKKIKLVYVKKRCPKQ